MKVDEGIKTLAELFNDIISALIPGLFFCLGVDIIHGGQIHKLTFQMSGGHDGTLWLVAPMAFIVGHAMLQLHTFWLNLRSHKEGANSDKKFPTTIEKRKSYVLFKALVEDRIMKSPASSVILQQDWGVRDLRNFAMTASPDAASLGRRFMAISLLCSGTCVACFLLELDLIAKVSLQMYLWNSPPNIVTTLIAICLLPATGIAFSSRSKEFKDRAERTPFDVATSDLLLQRGTDSELKK